VTRPRRPLAILLRQTATLAFAAFLALVGTWLWVRAAPLLDVQLPVPGQTVGHEGIELLVRFPSSGRARVSTFRALLNGADVTAGLDTAENGVYGTLQGLLDGENVLRLEVFGRPPWPIGPLWEETRELRINFRRSVSSDRA
jgi:hypothetical protein